MPGLPRAGRYVWIVTLRAVTDHVVPTCVLSSPDVCSERTVSWSSPWEPFFVVRCTGVVVDPVHQAAHAGVLPCGSTFRVGDCERV